MEQQNQQVDTVEMLQQESALDDAAQAPQDQLEDVFDEAAKPTEQKETEKQRKPGWIQQRIEDGVSKRIEDVIAKTVRQTEERVSQRYEPRLQALQESIVKSEAQNLVNAGEVKSLEVAQELVRRRLGIPLEGAGDTKVNPQRKAYEQPAEEPEDQSTDVRASMLAKQAKKLSDKGYDVMAAFNSDPQTKQRVLSGEWDFYDVADSLDSVGKRNAGAPVPVRSPNGKAAGTIDLSKLTAEQLEEIDKKIASGSSFRV